MIVINLKECNSVLQFLDVIIRELKLQPFYAVNLEILGKTLSSLEKHGFTFPLTLQFVNTKNYRQKCPQGWRIFKEGLEKATEEYNQRELQFNWECKDEY